MYICVTSVHKFLFSNFIEGCKNISRRENLIRTNLFAVVLELNLEIVFGFKNCLTKCIPLINAFNSSRTSLLHGALDGELYARDEANAGDDSGFNP